jgi:DNA invertase Pin-like site-specific DNA recombinase
MAERWDVLVVYKQDRLARNFMAFFKVVGELQERGRTIASVSESLDLSTPMGMAQAGVLAGMAEQTARDISMRVADARRHLQHQGRVVGGKVVYGWMSVPNPAGPGLVLTRDPERIVTVRLIVDRTLAGLSVYSTVQHLNETGVPSPTGRGPWVYSSVERLLRHRRPARRRRPARCR